MWLFTDLGFYSINRTPDGAKLQFRARRKKDLENLKRAFREEFRGETITTWPEADYRWRLECSSGNAGVVMCAMTERIQYRNFKNHIAGTDQADKLTILHAVWHDMHAYQGTQEHLQPGPDKRTAAKRKKQAAEFHAAESFYDQQIARYDSRD